MKQINLFFKTMLILCALVWSGNCAWADTATITFSSQTSGTSDSGTAYTTSNLVSSGITSSSAAFGTITCSATSRCYSGKTGCGMKVGASSNAGSFTIAFSTPLTNVTKITLDRASYSSTKTASITVKNGNTTLGTESTPSNTDFSDMDITNLSINSLNGLTVQSNKYCYIKSITITYTPVVSGVTAAPTISGEVSFLNSTEVTITNDASADGASIYYTLNGDDPTTTTSATCFEYTKPFTIDATTTVKAIAKKSDTNASASAVVSKVFTKIIPQTVADALGAIDALANNGTIDNQYVKGIVSSVGTTVENGKIKYYISDDGSDNNQLYVFKGKGLNNGDFTTVSDVLVGDEVIVRGQLMKYVKGTTITPEFSEGSYLVSQIHKTTPTFSLDVTAKSLDAYTHETVDVALTTNTDGVISCESSNTDVATVALKSTGIYTITAQAEGTATITIKSAVSSNYAPASATVSITVTDNRADAGISFASASVSKTWGESFTGQELTNTNSLAVTYSSTEEDVATVSSTGVVTMKKAGTTIIKATFTGNDAFKAAVAQYTLTISKAEPELSFAETSFDIELGADGNNFVAPALVNPNKLTVQYSSSNEKVAIVDENSGEVVIETGAEGTATITAYFIGDDCYNGGNAKYTINIIDYNKKGSKYNPYTVAEVASLTETLSGVYITGYIVGCVNNNKCYKTTTASLVNANILLADTPDKSFTEGGQISNESGLCPVELPTSPKVLREKWGLMDNNVLGYKVICKGTEQAYYGKRGMKSTSEISAVSVPVSISAAGLATFASDEDLDFTNVENIQAYVAKDKGSKTTLEKVNKVPAGTGVLLRALNDATSFDVPVTTTATEITGNLFVRGTGAAVASIDGDYTNYVLGKKNGEVGFFKAGGKKVEKNQAYLHLNTTQTAPNLTFDDLTGIAVINEDLPAVNNGTFDLQGRRVAEPAKGFYIKNGKKVVK